MALAFWMLGRLPLDRLVRDRHHDFLGLGTVLWYAAELGSTWFLAHVVAVGLTLAAIAIALDADPRAASGDDRPSTLTSWSARRFLGLDRRQFLAGILFGLACTARLTVVFGAPFFVLVGRRRLLVPAGGRRRRSGTAIPVGIFLAYNLVTTGHLMSTGLRLPLRPRDVRLPSAQLPRRLGDRGSALPDPEPAPDGRPARPIILPRVRRRTPCAGLFSATCPIIAPNAVGMSLFLTSPAWLLGFLSLRWWGVDRLVTGCAIAVVAIAVVNLMHFSQGWVQFGYRFSNDFAPFALILVALALQASRHRGIGYASSGCRSRSTCGG